MLGRSNSLSLNTGATNSLFSQQQQSQNASSQPPPAGGLFSSSTQSSQPQQSGGLFGSSTTQTGGGGGGLFGSSTQQQQQPPPGGGLFGSSTTQQPQQQSSGLFGGSNTQSNMTSNQGTGLFGSSLNVPSQPQQQSGLFGSSTTQTRPGTGLFGAPAPTQSAPPGSSIFGGTAQPTSLFAGTNNQNQQPGQPSIFASQSQQQQQPNPTIFGLSASQPNQSLLGASMHRTSQMQPGSFTGKLTMGQPQAQQAAQGQGAVKINFDALVSTTRYADCIDDVKKDLENVDKMIQNQERFCREIEAFLPTHGADVKSLAPDVNLIKEKVEGVENGLAFDARGVETQRKILESDNKDFDRCKRVLTNQALPSQYHFAAYGTGQTTDGTESHYDADLIGNYFVPLTSSLQSALDNYASNLKAIEAHMRVIETSTATQAQQLAARRAGLSNGGSGAVGGVDTVRELADTLRGFEAGILTSAGLVGQCREGVNELVVGRVGRPW